MKKTYLFLPVLAFLSSCGRSSLTVQTDYLTHKNLASYYVDTPDPRLNVAAVGERLIVGWSVPKCYLSYENLHLKITIRFRNREEIIEIFHLFQTRGTYIFTLLNADYIEKRGILTYKIDLIGGNQVLEEWRHRIWTDLISLSPEQTLEQNLSGTSDEEKEIMTGSETEIEKEEYPINWNNDLPL